MIKYLISTVIFLFLSLPFFGLPRNVDSVIITFLSLILILLIIYALYKNQHLLNSDSDNSEKIKENKREENFNERDKNNLDYGKEKSQ